MNKAGQGNAQNVKHNKGERNVCQRSMRFSDRAFIPFATLPGSVPLSSSAKAWATMPARP